MLKFIQLTQSKERNDGQMRLGQCGHRPGNVERKQKAQVRDGNVGEVSVMSSTRRNPPGKPEEL